MQVVSLERNAGEDVDVVAVRVDDFRRRVGVGIEPIGEDEQTGEADAEDFLPLAQPVEVGLCDPVFPGGFAAGLAAYPAAALDVDEPVGVAAE